MSSRVSYRIFCWGGEVIVKVVLACVSTATHMSACEQPSDLGACPKMKFFDF